MVLRLTRVRHYHLWIPNQYLVHDQSRADRVRRVLSGACQVGCLHVDQSQPSGVWQRIDSLHLGCLGGWAVGRAVYAMTAPELLGLIVAALLLQSAVEIGWSVWQRRAESGDPPDTTPTRVLARSQSAWMSWREFHVVRRSVEDAVHSQCSFYLSPVDGQPLSAFETGQFLTFSLDVAGSTAAATRPVTRCYSLSERPDPAYYRVTIKRVPAPADHPEWTPGRDRD